MNTLPATIWTVKQVLDTFPETIPCFIHYQTDCIGCLMNRFCILDQVCTHYQIDPADFFHTLINTVHPITPEA